MSELREARNTFAGVTMILGALLAVPAIISMIQHIFDIGLTGYFADFVDFYRKLVTPAIDVIQWPFRMLFSWLRLDWTIPQWVKDLHTLSFVGAGIYFRSVELATRHIDKRYGVKRRISGLLYVWTLMLAIGFAFAGILLLVWVWLPSHGGRHELGSLTDLTARVTALVVIAAVFAFLHRQCNRAAVWAGVEP